MIQSFDIERARAETRGCGEIIHFNNAGASLMPVPVADALVDYLREEELRGGYETAGKHRDGLDNFYTATSKLLNCAPDEVAFIENATRAWDMAFYGFRFNKGDKILTSIAEYGSNVIAFIQQAERYGAEIVYVPNDGHGQLDVAALENMLDEQVKLVAISHIPTGGGLVNPVEAVGKVANSAGIPYLLDSCQGVGQLHLDVQQIGCDILSGTGRKYLRGPRGTGLLYIRKSLMVHHEPAMLDQHAAFLTSPTTYELIPTAKRYENWERFFAGQVALGMAIDYALGWDVAATQQRVFDLAAILRQKLQTIDGLTIADEGEVQCGLVTWWIEGISAEKIKSELAKQNINVTVSSGSGTYVSFQQRGLTELIRTSVHYFNTVEEIDFVIDLLKTIYNR